MIGGVPVGEPPNPTAVRDLAELAERLRELRGWANLSLRDVLGRVEDLRRRRGQPAEPGLCPSYGAVQALFQPNRKRLDEGLLIDVVRVLLDCQAPPTAWREEQVNAWRLAYRTSSKRPVREVHSTAFRLGPLCTHCHIVEGDGEHVIDEENVRVLVVPEPVRLPREVAEWREQIVIEQRRRRNLGEEYIWAGPRYAVDDFIIARVGIEENPEVTLRLKHSDYYTFLATQQLDRELSSGATLRSLYLDGRDPRDVPDFMRSSFGLNVALVTADGWLVVSRRSKRLGVGKGLWNSSANEGLHRHLDSPDGRPPNLFRAAERGVREELRLSPDQYALRLLAFVVVTSFSQWAALFLARLNSMSRRGFEDNAGRGIQDGWEHPEFDYVKFEPDHLIRYLLRDDRQNAWAPAAPVLFYLSLVNAYGHRAVDQAVEFLI